MLRESLFDVFYHNSRAYNPVLWTMQVELYGSFLVFGFLLVFGRLRYRPLAYAALVILFFDTYYLGFILGMLVSDLSANGLFARLKDKLPLVAGLLVAGITLGLYNIPENGSSTMYSLITFNIPDVKFGILYTTLGAAMILFALVNSTHMQRFFSNRVMDFLGKLSFSLYLLHLSIIFTFSCFMFGYLERSLTYNSSVLLTFPPTLALVVASSWVMYRYVDIGSVWAGKLLWEKVYGMAKKAAPGR
jgi:peptidoglycan/LPS O-acetylase OafA/YrhL